MIKSYNAIILLLIVSCSGQRNITSTQNETEILKKLEYDAIAAEFRLDTASISKVMHDDFVAVYPHTLQNKQQELAGIYKGMVQRSKEGETMDSLYLDDFQARFFNNTAVVTFFTVTKGRKKDMPFQNRRMRWYDVWIKEKGGWKFVSAQGTPIQ